MTLYVKSNAKRCGRTCHEQHFCVQDLLVQLFFQFTDEVGDMSLNWIEVWADLSLSPPYVLIVKSTPHMQGRCIVLDPQEDGKQVSNAESYETAKLWLLEDEYERLGTRVDE